MKKIIVLLAVLLPHILVAKVPFSNLGFKANNTNNYKNPLGLIQKETNLNFEYSGKYDIALEGPLTIKFHKKVVESSKENNNNDNRKKGSNAIGLNNSLLIRLENQKRIENEVQNAPKFDSKSTWFLQSTSYTFESGNSTPDENEIKKVIESQTQASYDRNLVKALSYWANVPYASYVLTSLNANLSGFEQIKNTYTFFMKANPTPDKSKIETTYRSIKIIGNTAFVKHEEAFTSEKGITTKQNCHRYLEKINTEWKLVGSVVTPMPTVKTDDEKAIKKVIEAETQAYLDGDGKKLQSYWSGRKSDEHASQYLVPVIGQPYAKAESMEKLVGIILPNLKKQEVKVEREDFEIRINKDMAWATYTQKASANGIVTHIERETRILERIGGEWKIVYVGEQGVK